MHATKNLAATLRNVRSLLKPGGRLLFAETTIDRLDVCLIFGPLEGWWLGEEPSRSTSPHASREEWDALLRATGFSGIDFDKYDYDEQELKSGSTILTTAVSTSSLRTEIVIVHDRGQSIPSDWVSYLCKQIEQATGVLPTVEDLDQLDPRDRLCIFVAELDRPFVSSMDEIMFNELRNLILNSRGVLWLSSGGLADGLDPSFAATQGLLRTLRLEDTSHQYIHLDFEPSSGTWTHDKIDHIVHVVQQSCNNDCNSPRTDSEYAVKQGLLYVPRLIPDRSLSQHCSEQGVEKPSPTYEPFIQSGRPLVWEVSNSGLLNEAHFTDKIEIDDKIPNGYVEVDSRAFGLNFRDVLVALGQLEETIISHEVGGVITCLGPSTEDSGLRVGDRVCGVLEGRFASLGRAPWQCVVKIPDDMPFETAAAVPTAYATAYHSLVHLGRVLAGETVLIHAAAGGFGQAAIVLAQHLGARVFATCSSEAKRDVLMKDFGIPLEHILSSRDVSFAPAVMKLTGGKGVDIVLNSLSGAMLKATWDCVARFGRFIELGKVDMEAARQLDMSPFCRCVTFTSVDLLQLKEHNPSLVREALQEGLKICYGRDGPPLVPITPYPISQIEDAMRLMQSGKYIGKLVLVPGVDDKVKVQDSDSSNLLHG